MARILRVGIAQMGPVSRNEKRSQVIERLIIMMRTASEKNADIVVFPELALTTFFPRWAIDTQEVIDSFFELEMPSSETQALFEVGKELGIGFHLGYAEKVEKCSGKAKYLNTAFFVDSKGIVKGKYRKIHLPGYSEPQPGQKHQHLEKRYFSVGDMGFPAFRAMNSVMGICICNDRRWPETYRVLGLQGVEVIMIGYNTPMQNSYREDEPSHLGMFHNHLSMQAGAYQNCGWEDGVHHMGGSCIIAPTGEIIARSITETDEVFVADCNLDMGAYLRDTVFNFDAHRRPEHYGIITSQTGAMSPPEDA